jgi:ParB/RepB/Spo0J family partition protein
MKVRDLPLERLFVTKNVRLEKDGELGDLMESIEHHEMLQPIGVFPRGERYEVVWGHRRLAAARMRNECTIACRILEGIPESDIPLIKLQENVQRKQLTAEEIVAAADEIKLRKPGTTEAAIDRMLGKQPGYLSNMRSTVRASQYLVRSGIKRKVVETMWDDELRGMRADMEAHGEERRGRRKTFHRGPDTPAKGFRVVNSPGPNVVVICAGPEEKLRVIKSLRELARKVSA